MEKPKKEKPTLSRRCGCGRLPITVKSNKKYLVTCPAVMDCPHPQRTRWHSKEENAILEWEKLGGVARSWLNAA